MSINPSFTKGCPQLKKADIKSFNPCFGFLFFTRKLICCILVFGMGKAVSAQNYTALYGSPYAGALSMYNNPATTINGAYKWNINLISAQGFNSQNMVEFSNASITDYKYRYISSTNASGAVKKDWNANADATVLNFSLLLNKKSAISFGARTRGYFNAKMHGLTFSDTTQSLAPIFLQNLNKPVEIAAGGQAWMEYTLNYSRIVKRTKRILVSVGANLGYTMPYAGGRLSLYNFQVIPIIDPNGEVSFKLNAANGYFAYTPNVGEGTNFSMQYTNKNSFNFSIGGEVLLKSKFSVDLDPINPLNYDWKFGISIMDMGKSQFKASGNSVRFGFPNNNATDDAITNSFKNVTTLNQLKTELRKFFVTIDSISNFTIALPKKVVLYIDKNFQNNIYLNLYLNLNLNSNIVTSITSSGEGSFLVVTPRWEKRNLGVFLPIQLTATKEIWVGAAFKAGPLTVGLHNFSPFSWLKKGTHTFNGGGYISLNIHPFRKQPTDLIDCPKF